MYNKDMLTQADVRKVVRSELKKAGARATKKLKARDAKIRAKIKSVAAKMKATRKARIRKVADIL